MNKSFIIYKWLLASSLRRADLSKRLVAQWSVGVRATSRTVKLVGRNASRRVAVEGALGSRVDGQLKGGGPAKVEAEQGFARQFNIVLEGTGENPVCDGIVLGNVFCMVGNGGVTNDTSRVDTGRSSKKVC